MSPLAILTLLVGVLILAFRAPLLFAPVPTLAWYERLVRSDAALRAVGVLLAVLGVPLVVLTRGGEDAVLLMAVLGWLFVLAALWLLLFPASYRRLALRILEFFRHSVDPAATRSVGLVGAAIALALIYLALFVL